MSSKYRSVKHRNLYEYVRETSEKPLNDIDYSMNMLSKVSSIVDNILNYNFSRKTFYLRFSHPYVWRNIENCEKKLKSISMDLTRIREYLVNRTICSGKYSDISTYLTHSLDQYRNYFIEDVNKIYEKTGTRVGAPYDSLCSYSLLMSLPLPLTTVQYLIKVCYETSSVLTYLLSVFYRYFSFKLDSDTRNYFEKKLREVEELSRSSENYVEIIYCINFATNKVVSANDIYLLIGYKYNTNREEVSIYVFEKNPPVENDMLTRTYGEKIYVPSVETRRELLYFISSLLFSNLLRTYGVFKEFVEKCRECFVE